MDAYTMKGQIEKQQKIFDKFVVWLGLQESIVAVTPASKEEDLAGIDLWVVIKDSSAPIGIQVKVDFIIDTTGNLAVETVGQARYEGEWKPGWLSHLHSTKWLVYICGASGRILIYPSRKLYAHVIDNMGDYKAFSTMSGDDDGGDFWNSMGVLVPACSLKELEIKSAKL